MKLENCGRCGLEPGVEFLNAEDDLDYIHCPACGGSDRLTPYGWNAAQFAHKTKRINAAAVLAWAQDPGCVEETVVRIAGRLIDAEDAATRWRWAEMQKGV